MYPAAPFNGVKEVVSFEQALQEAPPEAQGVLFRSISISTRLPRLSLCRFGIRYVPMQYDRQFADLSTTYDQYLDTFSAKSRSTLRRKVRHFEKASGGWIDYRCYKTREEVERFYGHAREISAQSYQEHLLDAGLPSDASFLTDALEAAESGNVRAYLIFFDEKPIAYLYCPLRAGVVSYAYLGYRAELRAIPGNGSSLAGHERLVWRRNSPNLRLHRGRRSFSPQSEAAVRDGILAMRRRVSLPMDRRKLRDCHGTFCDGRRQ